MQKLHHHLNTELSLTGVTQCSVCISTTDTTTLWWYGPIHPYWTSHKMLTCGWGCQMCKVTTGIVEIHLWMLWAELRLALTFRLQLALGFAPTSAFYTFGIRIHSSRLYSWTLTKDQMVRTKWTGLVWGQCIIFTGSQAGLAWSWPNAAMTSAYLSEWGDTHILPGTWLAACLTAVC